MGGLGRGGAARLFPSTQSPDHHNGRLFCPVPGEGCCSLVPGTLRRLWPPPLPARLCLPGRRGGAARLVPLSLGRAGQSGHELGLGLQLPLAGRKPEGGSRSRGTVGMPAGLAGLLGRPGRGALVKLGEPAPVLGAPGAKVLSRSPRPGGEGFQPLRPTPACSRPGHPGKATLQGPPAVSLHPCRKLLCGCPGLRCPCASFSAPPAPAQHLLLQEASLISVAFLGPQGPQLRPGRRLPTFPWDERQLGTRARPANTSC